MPLGEHVERVLTDGSAAHPMITAGREPLRRLIAKRLQDEEGRTSIDCDELYLAAACVLGDAAAIRTFEQRYFAALPDMLTRLSLAAAEIGDVEQMLRQRLFAGTRRSKSVTLHSGPSMRSLDPIDAAAESGEPSEVPRVVAYAGQGQLASLVRVAAIRAAVTLLRDRGRLGAEPIDGLDDVPVRAGDTALAALKAKHRAEFRRSFEQALATLDAQQRSLLGLAVVRGLGIERIAAIFHVHRATAARWIHAARSNLTRATYTILAAKLSLSSDRAASELQPLVEAQLELSLERLLRTRAETTIQDA